MKSFKQHFLTEANNLAPGELYKYQVRVDKFIEKLKKKSPFVLTTGETVVLQYDKAVADAILNKVDPTKIILKVLMALHHILLVNLQKQLNLVAQKKSQELEAKLQN